MKESISEVGLFIENEKLEDISAVDLDCGNPGLPGSEFQILSLFKSLSQRKNFESIRFKLLATNPNGLSFFKDLEFVNGIEDIARFNPKISKLIIYPRSHHQISQYEQLINSGIIIIPWLHLTPTKELLDFFAKNRGVNPVVCVGHDQRMRFIDHPVFEKCITIPNIFEIKRQDSRFKKLNGEPNKNVVFLGALVPQKSFHWLSSQWPKVVSKVPDAKLEVIGSGSLYDRFAKFGRLSLTSNAYEKKITKHLSRNQIKGVTFHGKLGLEKYAVISQSLVGVVNPSGKTETCCISTIEFSYLGKPVLSSKRYGIPDTVVNGKTGILVSNKKQLKRALVYLLNNPKVCEDMGKEGMEFVQREFSKHKLLPMWADLLILPRFQFAKKYPQSSKILDGYFLNKMFKGMRKWGILPKRVAHVDYLIEKIKGKFRKILEDVSNINHWS